MDNMSKQNMEQNVQNEQATPVVEFSPAAQNPASKKPQSMWKSWARSTPA